MPVRPGTHGRHCAVHRRAQPVDPVVAVRFVQPGSWRPACRDLDALVSVVETGAPGFVLCQLHRAGTSPSYIPISLKCKLTNKIALRANLQLRRKRQIPRKLGPQRRQPRRLPQDLRLNPLLLSRWLERRKRLGRAGVRPLRCPPLRSSVHQ